MRIAPLVIAAMLGGLAAPAAAGGFDRTFAELVGVEPSAVVDATAFGLASGAYTHVVVGHVRREDREEPHAYLLRCDAARCVGTPLWLEPGTLEVLGVVDLDGPAVAFPRRPVAPRVAEPLGARRMKRPVLIVQSTHDEVRTTTNRMMREVTGTLHERSIALVPLARAERVATRLFAERVEARWPTGAGFVTTLSFEREARGPLVLVASEQRLVDNELACLPPPPTITRYRVGKDGRYAEARGLPGRAGC